jgi:16S rRNA (adenine1518-N6/adenine1519-N6)-dimethyltransferase
MRLQPKKRLGQNFLIDKNIRNKIIDSLELMSGDTVVEIGPGKGELTRLIAESVNCVLAIEIDRNLASILKEELKEFSNVRIITADFLKTELWELISIDKGSSGKLKVFGNIPYYITTPIIARLIKYRRKIRAAFLTVQKEFAQRIIAAPGTGDYGSFSCFVQYYTEPEIIFLIKKNSFFPVPKVDSAFLRLNFKQELPLKARQEQALFKVTRAAFNQRRKTLRNSLAGIISEVKLNKFFNKYGLDTRIRPQDLSLQDFINLSKI